MIINNVRIFLTPRVENSSLRAIATVLVNNQLLLQSIRIFQNEGENGEELLQVSYPIQHMNNGSLRRCMYPSNAQSRKKFDSAILEAYKKVLSGEVSEKTVVLFEDSERTPYEITRASVFSSRKNSQVRAKLGLELDGEIWIRGMYLLARENGSLFLNMPQRQVGGEKGTMAYFHPIDQESRNILTAAAMPFYDEACASR